MSVPLAAPCFDLRRTLECGQVFHWTPTGEAGAYRGVIGSTPVSVRQEGETLHVPRGREALCRHYFALDHPLEAIYATFPTDPAMREALAFCHGMRILRQPLWECLATFITSAMKQVRHIAAISHTLRERYGRRVAGGLRAYPGPRRLARCTEAELRECGLGFRAGKLLATARMVAAGEVDLEAIRSLPDAEALAELCRLPGVGAKIANCVLLFAYERVRAFPIDVWIARAVRHHYARPQATLPELAAFCADYFGPYGGYAQQYLFHHARNRPRSFWQDQP